MSDQQQLGGHEARIATLEKIAEDMQGDLREVRDFVIAIKAKWRVMSGVLVACGAIFGAIASFVADILKTAVEKRIG